MNKQQEQKLLDAFVAVLEALDEAGAATLSNQEMAEHAESDPFVEPMIDVACEPVFQALVNRIGQERADAVYKTGTADPDDDDLSNRIEEATIAKAYVMFAMHNIGLMPLEG